MLHIFSKYTQKVVQGVFLLLLLLGMTQTAHATDVSLAMSGTSYVDCYWSELQTGVSRPSGVARVISGVSGGSTQTYTVPVVGARTADGNNENHFIYTLAPSVANPIYELGRIIGPGSFQHDVAFRCYPVEDPEDGSAQGYTGMVTVSSDVRGITFGSYASSYLAMLHGYGTVDRDNLNRIMQYTMSHTIVLEEHVKGPKQTTHTASGTFTHPNIGDTNKSLSISGNGTIVSETAYARSYVVAGDGSYIAGPFVPGVGSCGVDITYPMGLTGVSGSAQRSTSVSESHIDNHIPGNSYSRSYASTEQLGTNEAKTLGGRSVVYYSVPQFLISQGVCSATTALWTNQTVYSCNVTSAPGAGDAASVAAANPGSHVETFFATEAGPPGYEFLSYADMFGNNSFPNAGEESLMREYAAHVPLNMNSCTEGGNATPLLACVVSVSTNKSPAITSVDATWVADVSNASGQIQYEWSGTDGLARSFTTSNTTDLLTKTYASGGTKNAQVLVRSGGQEAICTQNLPTIDPISGSCYPSPASIVVPGSMTWISNITGGVAPYTYSWSGTDGLSGSNATAAKYYTLAGSKTAQVTVTDSMGTSKAIACTAGSGLPATPSEYTLSASVVGQCRINSGDGGISCGGDCSESYTSGTAVTLTALPSNNLSVFVGWGGECSGASGNTCNLTMNSSKVVSAQCAPLPKDFTISSENACTIGAGKVSLSWTASQHANAYLIVRTPQGGGPVVLYPDGGLTISYKDGTIKASVPAGVLSFDDSGLTPGTTYTYQIIGVNQYGLSPIKTLTTTASLACTLSCTISADGNNTRAPSSSNVSIDSVSGTAVGPVTYALSCGGGTFSQNVNDNTRGTCAYTSAGSYTVVGTVTRGGKTAQCTAPVNILESNKKLTVTTQNCTVASSPAGISCGGDCTENYTHGTSVTLTATPQPGYKFADWSNACAGNSTTCTVAMTADKTANARCVYDVPQPACSIDLQVRNNSGTYSNGTVTLDYGKNADLFWNADDVDGSVATAYSAPVLGGWTGTQNAFEGGNTKTVTVAPGASRAFDLRLEGVNATSEICSDTVRVQYYPKVSAVPNVIPTCQPDNTSKINLSWSKTGALADTVTIFVGTPGLETPIATINCNNTDTCTYSHTGLTPGALYTYQLRNNNVNGSSALSASRSAVAPTCTVNQDLTVTNIVDSPTGTHYVGDTIVLAGIVKNLGTDGITNTWTDRFLIKKPSDSILGVGQFGGRTHTNLDAGTTYSLVSETVTLDEVGNWTIALQTDYNNTVAESNEENNVKTKTITVLDTPVTTECTFAPNTPTPSVGELVTWTATASGGDTNYDYRWYHPDGSVWSETLGTQLNVIERYKVYNNTTSQTPYVTITSGGDTATCSATVTPVPPPPPDPTFHCDVTVELVGGLYVEYRTTVTEDPNMSGRNYSYNWTRTGGASDSQASTPFLNQYDNYTFGSTGTKTITATVTRDDLASETCSDTVTLGTDGPINISCFYDYYAYTRTTNPQSAVWAVEGNVLPTYTDDPDDWDNYRMWWGVSIDHEIGGVQTPSNYVYDIRFAEDGDISTPSGWQRERTFLQSAIDSFMYFIPYDIASVDDLPTTFVPRVQLVDNNQTPAVASNVASCPLINVIQEPGIVEVHEFDYDYNAADITLVPGGASQSMVVPISMIDPLATTEVVTLTTPNLPSGVTATFSPVNCSPNIGCSITITFQADGSATVTAPLLKTVVGNSPTTATKYRTYFLEIVDTVSPPDVDLYITDKTRGVYGGSESVRRGNNALLKWAATDNVVSCSLVSDKRGALNPIAGATNHLYTNVSEIDVITISCLDDIGGSLSDYLEIEPFGAPPGFEEF